MRASFDPNSKSDISRGKTPGVSNKYMLGWLAIWDEKESHSIIY